MAAVTAFGSFGGPERARGGRVAAAGFGCVVAFVVLRALTGDALVFAMQVVYRSVQMMREDVPCDRPGHEIIDPLVRCQPGADLCRRHVTRVRVDPKYRSGLGIRRCADGPHASLKLRHVE